MREEVEQLLKKLEEEAIKQFGDKYFFSSDGYPLVGSINPSPRRQGDYVVTIGFLRDMLKDESINDFEDFQTEITSCNNESSELSDQLKAVGKRKDLLYLYRHFVGVMRERIS